MPILHPSVTHAAAWRLCTEIARRHPTAVIREGHSALGMNDDLVVTDPDRHWSVRCNLDGIIHALPPGDGEQHRWEYKEYLEADPKQFVRTVESHLGVRRPGTVPPTGNRQLTYRVIAELMASETLTPHGVRMLSGWDESAECADTAIREDFFAAFPSIDPHLLSRRHSKWVEPAERFWFLIEDGAPVLAFETDSARVWRPGGGNPCPRMVAYNNAGRRLTPTVASLNQWRTQPPTIDVDVERPYCGRGEKHPMVLEHFHDGRFAGWWTFDSPMPTPHYLDEHIEDDGMTWVIDHKSYDTATWVEQCLSVDGVGDETTTINLAITDDGMLYRPPVPPADLDITDTDSFPTLLGWYARGEATAFDVYAHYVDTVNLYAADRTLAHFQAMLDGGLVGVPVGPATWLHVEQAHAHGVLNYRQYSALKRLFALD